MAEKEKTGILLQISRVEGGISCNFHTHDEEDIIGLSLVIADLTKQHHVFGECLLRAIGEILYGERDLHEDVEEDDEDDDLLDFDFNQLLKRKDDDDE